MIKSNLFIVGAPKCGTTALANQLSSHPDIYLPEIKETFFFSRKYIYSSDRWGLGDDIQNYLRLYEVSKGEKYRIDASTTYLRSREAISDILKFNPISKFIVMIREPSEVAYAYHMQCLASGLEDETEFYNAWRDYEIRKVAADSYDGPRRPDLYQEVAKLGSQIEDLLKLVPNERLLIINQEDMKRNNVKVYKNVIEFLGLNYNENVDFSMDNSAHASRFRFVNKFLNHPPEYLSNGVVLLRKLYKKTPFIAVLKKGIMSRGINRKELESGLRAEMREYFTDEVDKLEYITGFDLSSWKAVKE